MIAVLAFVVATAAAKELTVTDQEQVVIQQLCDTAALNPNLTRELRASVAAWCVQWDARMKKANEPEKTDAR